MYEKDPSKLGQWDPNEMMPVSSQIVHRSNTSATDTAVEHRSGPIRHPGFRQQQLQEHTNDDEHMSSNEDEDNDNDHIDEMGSMTVNNFSTTTGSGSLVVNRHSIDLNSSSIVGSSCEDSAVINKQFTQKVQYHLPASDKGMVSVVPAQHPQQTMQHVLKKKFSNSSDSSLSLNSGKSRVSPGDEMHFVYLKKVPPQTLPLASSNSGSVITSVVDYSNGSTVNIIADSGGVQSLEEINKGGQSTKLKSDNISEITNSIKTMPAATVSGVGTSVVSNIQNCSSNNISCSGKNFVSRVPVTMDSSNNSVNFNSTSSCNSVSSNNNTVDDNPGSDYSSNRSVIQRLNCNLDHLAQQNKDNLSNADNLCANKNNEKQSDIVSQRKPLSIKEDYGCNSGSGSIVLDNTEKIKSINAETIIADLNSERTKVADNSAVELSNNSSTLALSEPPLDEFQLESKIIGSTITNAPSSVDECS